MLRRVIAAALLLSGCHDRSHSPHAHVPVPVPEIRSDHGRAAVGAPGSEATPLPEVLPAPPLPLPPPAKVEKLRVPDDIPASIVRDDTKPPLTVFLPGLCSSASAYLHTFREAARAQGGVIAIEGDQPCGADGYRSFSWDAGRQHARVEAALAAAGLTTLPEAGITIVGYSQGAALAEQMLERWPTRYTKVVLIGAPTDPSAKRLARARAVVTMSCDRDVTTRMKQAAAATKRAGTPALYVEMPGCSHGNVGDPERTFGTTFEFLRTSAL